MRQIRIIIHHDLRIEVYKLSQILIFFEVMRRDEALSVSNLQAFFFFHEVTAIQQDLWYNYQNH